MYNTGKKQDIYNIDFNGENLQQLTDRCTAIIHWKRDAGSRRAPAKRLTIDNGVVSEGTEQTPEVQELNHGGFN